MFADDTQLLGSLRDEALLAGTAGGRWHAEYLGHAYRRAVEESLALVEGAPLTVLKTDLWNECLGGARDILGHLHAEGGHRLFGVDRALLACTLAGPRVPAARFVQADISALPFRTGSLDAVLDLSTLDHLSEAGMACAIGEYRRVLRDGGVVLLVFWQRSLLMRLRVLCKLALGLHEKSDQRYLSRTRVRASLGAGFAVASEFVAGLPLVAPHRVTSVLLARVSVEGLSRLLRRLVRLEHSRTAHALLRHVAGMYGLAALRRREAASG